MNDVMIDLETLDTASSSVILSIGAVRFDIEQIDSFGPTFSAHLKLRDQLCFNKQTISESTLFWWLSQSEEARNSLVSQDRVLSHEALLDFSQFITPTDRIWGNGADFDNAILANAYIAAGLDVPWRHVNNRCYRTLKTCFPYISKPEFVGIAHNAVDDAKNQARHLQRIWKHINECQG